MSLIQIGIDNWSVARRSKLGQSGGWPAAGGFGNGRKLPIVFAAALLDDQEMLNMSGEAPEASFGEDEHTEFGPSWTGARVRFTGQYPLAYKAEPERYLDRGPYEHLTPDKWPGRNATMSESYRRCCTSISWVGQALAVRLLRAEQVWNHEAFFVYVDRWMYENDEEAMAKIRQSHSNYGGMRQGSTHFDPWIDAMWKAHRTTLEAGIDDWKPRR